MRHGDLTREQAIAQTSLADVEAVEAANCEPTSRLQTDGDTDVEWSASVLIDRDGLPGVLTAYYYTTPAEALEEDLSNVDWQIHGYNIA